MPGYCSSVTKLDGALSHLTCMLILEDLHACFWMRNCRTGWYSQDPDITLGFLPPSGPGLSPSLECWPDGFLQAARDLSICSATPGSALFGVRGWRCGGAGACRLSCHRDTAWCSRERALPGVGLVPGSESPEAAMCRPAVTCLPPLGSGSPTGSQSCVGSQGPVWTLGPATHDSALGHGFVRWCLNHIF